LGKLNLIVVGMKMIWLETPWWEDHVARINDARADAGILLFFVGGERMEEAGEGEREGERRAGVFFFSSFSMAFHGVHFLGVECKSRNHAQ